MQNRRAQEDEDKKESNRGETLSGAWEKGQEFAEKWSERDDKKVIHCSKCQGAETTERLSKATLVFSLGAFVLSLAALVLPFFRTADAGFSTEQWDIFLTTLQDGIKVSEQVKPTTVVRPAITQPKSSAAPKPASSTASVAASSAEASSAPSADPTAGSTQTAEPAATGERPAP